MQPTILPPHSNPPKRTMPWGFIVLIVILWTGSVGAAVWLGRESAFSEVRMNGGLPLRERARGGGAVQVQTTVGEIKKRYDQNEVAAVDWLGGKRIACKGEIISVNSTTSGGADVTLMNSDSDYTVVFEFEASARTALAKVKKGDVVICTGQLSEQPRFGFLGPHFSATTITFAN